MLIDIKSYIVYSCFYLIGKTSVTSVTLGLNPMIISALSVKVLCDARFHV